MKFISIAFLLSSALGAPLLGGLLGGIAAVDAGGLSVLSPSQDTFKYNYNAGYGNWRGPQYVPMYGNPGFFAPSGLGQSGPQQGQAPPNTPSFQ